MTGRFIICLAALAMVTGCSPDRVAKAAQTFQKFGTTAKMAIADCGHRSHVLSDVMDNPRHDKILYACMKRYGFDQVVVERNITMTGPPEIVAGKTI